MIITLTGLVLVGISLSIVTFVISSNVDTPNSLLMTTIFEDVFDEISNEMQIMPDNSAYVSYVASFSDVLLLWGVQIIDYHPGDQLSISISNLFGDDYGESVQTESILFEVLEMSQSDMLNFEIKNSGSRNVNVVVMFSEDPENSDVFSNLNSSVMKWFYCLLFLDFY